MIKKFNGHLALPNGKRIECQGEINENPVLTDEEFLVEQTRKFNEAIKKFQIPTQIVISFDGSYAPTGPVVDSTLAEKDEEKQ
jgi:hypothetical protein